MIRDTILLTLTFLFASMVGMLFKNQIITAALADSSALVHFVAGMSSFFTVVFSTAVYFLVLKLAHSGTGGKHTGISNPDFFALIRVFFVIMISSELLKIGLHAWLLNSSLYGLRLDESFQHALRYSTWGKAVSVLQLGAVILVLICSYRWIIRRNYPRRTAGKYVLYLTLGLGLYAVWDLFL